jgi:hypothetical protein
MESTQCSSVKTSKEVQQAYRDRIKGDPEKYETQKKKDSERMRKVRANNKLVLSAKEKKRRKELSTNRKRKARSLLVNPPEATPVLPSPYSSQQSLGRAVHRVDHRLPHSPTKKKAVISTLYKKYGCYTPPPKKFKAPIEGEKEVLAFYMRDDISRLTAGKSEYVLLRNESNTKQYLQKRYLVYSLREAFQLFKEENPDIKLGKSKFASLRPRNVLTVNDTPHESCLCKTHENVTALLKSISATVGKDFPFDEKQLLAALVCSSQNVECMTCVCVHCGSLANLCVSPCLVIPEELQQSDLTWESWEYEDGKIEKNVHEGTVEDALKVLKKQLPKYLQHEFIKQKQSKFFQEALKSASAEHVVLQVDFAENYSARYQNAVQSTYFNNTQVTIFTAVAWYAANEKMSFAIISQDNNHNKIAVHVFIKKIVCLLKERLPGMRFMDIFSDGAASQFKQKYNFVNLTFFKLSYGIDVTWHFFASGHGKGACDGIGGTIKRLVWQYVRSGRITVTDAASFHACALTRKSAINILLVTAEEVHQEDELLNDRWKDIIALPGTQSMHFFSPVAPNIIHFKLYSSDARVPEVHIFRHDAIAQCTKEAPSASSSPSSVKSSKENTREPRLGDIYKVMVMSASEKKHCPQPFLAMIQQVRVTNSVKVAYLKATSPSGLCFTLTEEVDYYACNELIDLVEVPSLSNRGIYSFVRPPLK